MNRAERGGGPLPIVDYPATPLVLIALIVALVLALFASARAIIKRWKHAQVHDPV